MRVYYEDTDAGGVVYHGNYFRWMDKARTEWMRSLGYDLKQMFSDRVALVVGDAKASYRRPTRLDDELLVRSRLMSIQGARVEFEQNILTKDEEHLCCQGSIILVCVSMASLRPCPLPDKLQKICDSLSVGLD